MGKKWKNFKLLTLYICSLENLNFFLGPVTEEERITTGAKLDYDKVVRGVVAQIGFDSFVDDLSSVDSKGLSHKTCEVLVRINKQSPDIAGGVHVGKDEMDVGAGDQGIMFGYASDETSDCMPLTHSMATRLGKTLTEVRKSGECWWLRPDGKTQVTIEYMPQDFPLGMRRAGMRLRNFGHAIRHHESALEAHPVQAQRCRPRGAAAQKLRCGAAHCTHRTCGMEVPLL